MLYKIIVVVCRTKKGQDIIRLVASDKIFICREYCEICPLSFAFLVTNPNENLRNSWSIVHIWQCLIFLEEGIVETQNEGKTSGQVRSGSSIWGGTYALDSLVQKEVGFGKAEGSRKTWPKMISNSVLWMQLDFFFFFFLLRSNILWGIILHFTIP